MEPVTIALLVVCAVAVGLAAGVFAAGRLAWRTVERRRVIVNLVDGSALAGLLWARRGPLLVLRNAVLHEHGQDIGVDGEAVVERSRVAWIQSLPRGEG